ncbi:MAG: hypothetical protein EAX96_13230 [Candidatus Lokiarchaeota archaeon]|nr:hypothetical protein [Candidatus Lokiarchaeota archaeon]
MINSIYVIHRSGSMLFNESWGDENVAITDRAHLISGLLTAFTGLTEEALKDQLKEIILQNQRILFKFFPSHYIVIVAKKNVESVFLQKILDKISDEFNIRFDIREFSGKIDEFRTFTSFVNKIINENKIKRVNIKENLKTLLRDEMLKLSLKKYGGEILD